MPETLLEIRIEGYNYKKKPNFLFYGKLVLKFNKISVFPINPIREPFFLNVVRI